MPLRETTIYVSERNDPQRTLWFMYQLPDKSWQPLDLSASVVEFWQKATSDEADGVSPTYTTANGSIVVQAAPPLDAKGVVIPGGTEKNVIVVKMTAANLAAPGVQFFRVDTITGVKRETIMRGPLVIENG